MITEKQADKIIDLLDSIDSRLAHVNNNTSSIESTVNSTTGAATLDDVLSEISTLVRVMKDLSDKLN